MHDALDKRIEAVCAQLVETIQARKVSLLKKSARVRATKLARLHSQAAAFAGHPTVLTKMQATFATLAVSKSDITVVAAVSNADSALRLVDQSSLRMEPCEDASLFERLDGSSLAKALSAFGIVGTPAEVRLAASHPPTPAPAARPVEVAASHHAAPAASAKSASAERGPPPPLRWQVRRSRRLSSLRRNLHRSRRRPG